MPFIPPLNIPRSPDRVRSTVDDKGDESVASSSKLSVSTPKKKLIPREQPTHKGSQHSIPRTKSISLSSDKSLQNDVAILQLKSSR